MCLPPAYTQFLNWERGDQVWNLGKSLSENQRKKHWEHNQDIQTYKNQTLHVGPQQMQYVAIC